MATASNRSAYMAPIVSLSCLDDEDINTSDCSSSSSSSLVFVPFDQRFPWNGSFVPKYDDCVGTSDEDQEFLYDDPWIQQKLTRRKSR